MKFCRNHPRLRFFERIAPLVLAMLGGAGLMGAAGCSSDCSDSGTCVEPCGVGSAAGSRGDECGVFLSASLGNDANPGTRAEPVKTLQHAVDVAASGPTVKGVYACAETFAEVIKLPVGVSLWGGLKCTEGWIERSDPTLLTPAEDAVPLTVEGKDGVEPWPVSEIVNLRLVAVDAVRPGGTSLAMNVTPYAAVRLLHSEVLAGDGAAPGGGSVAVFLEDHTDFEMRDCSVAAGDGADGADGKPDNPDPPPSGPEGRPGADACTAEVVAGAPASVAMLGDMVSRGGKGGDGGANTGTDGEAGTPEIWKDSPQYGGGGIGAPSSIGVCEDGKNGANAEDRPTSTGGNDFGTMTRAGWVGSAGKDGLDGPSGQGGGGGGGMRAGAMFCGTLPKGGASGGAGGAGGLGGKGGGGGGAGGASIGVFMLGRSAVIQHSTIKTGRGGTGGLGGAGGRAGDAFPGGRGGLGRGGSPNGCRGGNGGKGGNGGWGGGGGGGHSLGFVFTLSPGLITPDYEFVFQGGGAGSPGGAGGWNGHSLENEGSPGIYNDTKILR